MAHPELTGLSEWTTFNSNNVYTNKNFQKILEFFLFQCPVRHKSIRSRTFQDHGWQERYFSVLQYRLKNASDNEIKFYRVPVSNLRQTLEVTNQLAEVDCSYEVVIYHDSDNSMLTLFGAIRNAFAHGSFQIKTFGKIRFFCLENRTPPTSSQPDYYQEEVRARLVLKETTLLNWIRIIEEGYQRDAH